MIIDDDIIVSFVGMFFGLFFYSIHFFEYMDSWKVYLIQGISLIVVVVGIIVVGFF